MAGLSDEDVGLAPRAPRGLSDEDVGLAAPARGPIASQFGGTPGMPEGVDVPGAMAPDAAPPAEAPANAFAPPESVMPASASIADRFKPMVSEAFHGGSVGALTDRIQSGQVDQQGADQAFRAIVEARQAGSQVALRNFNPTPEEQKLYANNPSVLANPFVGVPLPELEAKFNALSQSSGGKREVYDAARDERRREFDALPGTFDAPTLGGKVANVITDAGGMLVGGAVNPENLIGGPGKGLVARQLEEGAVKYAVKEGAKDLARGATGGALGGAIANPAVQAGEISRGEREKFSPEELAANVVLGGSVGAAFHIPGIVGRPLLETIAKRRGVAIDHVDPATVGPAEIQEAFKDPQIAALAKANGIESPTDARVPVLEQKLAARKEAEALRTPDQPVQSLKAQDAEILRRQNEKAGVADETINPAATNLTTRTPDETPIRVDREGNAFRADAGALEGKAKAEVLQRADTKLLPAPGRAVPTDEEIALQRASSERGQAPDAETPAKLYGQEGRAPQTSENLDTQRQASEAFTLAQRQRDRAGADVRDTQTAGRPEGANPQTIHLDEGHPVEIVNRRMVPDAKGNMVDVATVRRYDPRTGKPADDHVEYDVPAKQLKTGQYAQEPRMAQDFEARAGTPEGEKMGLPRQTYRTTPPDDNAAGTARAARPEQPAGDHPGPRFSKAEEAMRDFADRQARGEANGPAGDQYAKQKTSTKAAKPDRDGRFTVDENGYVKSDKEGPVRFADQKQAAKWIINEGHKKSPDQVFEIANHPAGKGFTVRERGRTEPPAGGGPDVSGNKGPDVTGNKPQGARQIEGARAEAPRQSYDEQVKSERDRLWSEEMPGYSRDKTGNDGMVEASARETVMRREAVEQVAGAEREGLDDRGAHELAQLYRRADGETPQQAWDRAVDRWTEKTEAEAIAHENGMGAEDQAHDMLDRGGETLYTDNHDAIHGPEVDHEAIPFEHDTAGEPHGGDRGATAREGAERSGDGEAGGQAGRRSEDASRNTDAGPDGKRQTVIPGAERLTDRALAERQGSKPLKGGDEPSPKGGLFDEDARNQKDMFDPTRTMHANPLFDPAVWKWFGEKGLGFNSAWRRDMTGFATDWAKMKEADGLKGGKGNSLYQRLFSKNFSTYLFNSVDAEFRALGKLHNDSPTIKGLADSLQPIADVGRGGAVGQSFHEGVTERIVNGTNRLAKALEPFLDRPNAINQIVKLVQNRKSIKPGTPIHDAAAAIAKLLDDTHKYLNEAGVKVGKTPDYYPRSEIDSIKAISNPAAIQADMAKAYRASGLTATEAREAAEHWFERISLGSVNVRADGTDFLIHGGMPSSNFAKERVFSKEAHAFMEKWYHNDPTDAIPVYLQRAARRAEWARMMGGEVKDKTGKMVWDDNGKWKQMKADLIKEGNAGAVPEVVRLIAAATGVNPPAMPSVGRSALGLIRTMSAMKLLPHATLTNLTDMLMPGVRAGSVPRAVGDVFRTVKALLHTADMETTRAFAEDLGLITHGSTSGVMAARYNMDNPGNLLQERLQNRFWRGIGMEQLNQATRTVGTKSAEVFIRRQALDVAAGNKQATLSRRLLTELGVKDVDGFSKWVQSAANPRGDINSTGHADTYRNAVVRFVNQSSLLPTKSTKPSWANHPVGGLIYMLQSYNQAFMRDVYGRAKVQVGMAVSPKSGLSGMERARILTPIAMLPGLMAAQLAVGIPRQAILGSAGKQTETSDEAVAQLVIQAASRSLTASLDPFVQLYTSAKYHKSAGDFLHGSALSGPVNMIDALVGLLPKTASGGSNSAKTNSAERNAVRTTYDNILAPLVLSGTSMLPPQLGVPLSQAVTAGPVKDQLIDAVAGPKQSTGGHGRPQRPTRK